MFKELKKGKQGHLHHEEEMRLAHPVDVVRPPTKHELASKQKVVDELVIMRYADEDNDFLRITEMDKFEKFKNYKDSYPLFGFRMKLWNWYMYAPLTRWANYFAQKTIRSGLFETFSILLIIINSLFLALEDPTKDVQSTFLETVEQTHPVRGGLPVPLHHGAGAQGPRHGLPLQPGRLPARRLERARLRHRGFGLPAARDEPEQRRHQPERPQVAASAAAAQDGHGHQEAAVSDHHDIPRDPLPPRDHGRARVRIPHLRDRGAAAVHGPAAELLLRRGHRQAVRRAGAELGVLHRELLSAGRRAVQPPGPDSLHEAGLREERGKPGLRRLELRRHHELFPHGLHRDHAGGLDQDHDVRAALLRLHALGLLRGDRIRRRLLPHQPHARGHHHQVQRSPGRSQKGRPAAAQKK